MREHCSNRVCVVLHFVWMCVAVHGYFSHSCRLECVYSSFLVSCFCSFAPWVVYVIIRSYLFLCQTQPHSGERSVHVIIFNNGLEPPHTHNLSHRTPQYTEY